jgi:hypothetical protein
MENEMTTTTSDALKALLERVARLEAALAILNAAHEFEGEPDDKKLFVAMRVADLRRASAALNQETGQ